MDPEIEQVQNISDFNQQSHEVTPFKMSISRNMNKKKITLIVAAVLVVLLLVGGYYLYTTGQSSVILSPIVDSDKSGLLNKNNVIAPLTGELYTKEESDPWINVRPLAVMINNHTDARPQSGLVYADIIYEVTAEGGITRYLAFFNTTIPEKIGPVRSTREYYLVIVKELGDAMLMHIGWSPQALVAIESWPVRSLGRGGATFWRDNPRNVATEHTAYVNGKDLLDLGMELGWEGVSEFTLWEFKDDPVTTASDGTQLPPATKITIDFWYPGDFSANWVYNVESNSYLRSIGYDDAGAPIPDKDQETGEQVEVKNLLVQFAAESSIVGDDKSRLEYELMGSGDGLVFIDGVVHKVTWSKEDRDSRTLYYDTNGNPVKFNRGKFWISIVPDRNTEQVVYE